MNLWDFGAPRGIATLERRSALTQKLAQQTYDDVNRIRSSMPLLRQALGTQGNMGECWSKFVTEPLPKCEEALQALLDQLTLERHAGAYPANEHPPVVDQKWVEQLRELATNSAAGAERIAPLVLALFADGRKVSDSLFALYESGKKENLPLPLLSALKTAFVALDAVTGFELLPAEIQRLQREVAEFARFYKVFDLPESAALEAAHAALTMKPSTDAKPNDGVKVGGLFGLW
jgi:hypothetical protein